MLNCLFRRLAKINEIFLVTLTSSYRPSLNSSFIACFRPLNPLHTTVSPSSKTDGISAPFVLVLLESRYPKKLLDGLLRVVVLDLLRIVVLVLDSNIPALIVVVVLVLEVIPEAVSKERGERSGASYSSWSDSCIKSSSSDIVAGM